MKVNVEMHFSNKQIKMIKERQLREFSRLKSTEMLIAEAVFAVKLFEAEYYSEF